MTFIPGRKLQIWFDGTSPSIRMTHSMGVACNASTRQHNLSSERIHIFPVYLV